MQPLPGIGGERPAEKSAGRFVGLVKVTHPDGSDEFVEFHADIGSARVVTSGENQTTEAL